MFKLLNARNLTYAAFRSFSRNIQDPIVVTDDGSTVVCWHPEKPFPYECTQPMPKYVSKPTSILKETKPTSVYKKELPEFEREELMKMTYTTKHRWFPKNRLRERKTPRDREFL